MKQPYSATRTKAARDVLRERARQVTGEGFSAARDDCYTKRELAQAAAIYAAWSVAETPPPEDVRTIWPWDMSWFKPINQRRSLVKAGALILAEIERLDRESARLAESN